MITVYGSSDALVELEGDVTEEFYVPPGDKAVLAFSDGTVLRIEYIDEAIWRLSLVAAGACAMAHYQAPEDDEDNYSDRVELSGPAIRWVVLGEEVATAKAVTAR